MIEITLRNLAVVVFSAAALPAMAVEYQWTPVASAAAFAPRDGAGALTFNDRMWLLGGWNPSVFPKRSTNEVWTSTDGINWDFVNYAPWEPRHTAGYAVLDDKMWIVGGDPLQGHYDPPLYEGHYQPDVWNTSDGVNWTKVTASAPWGQRCLHCTIVHDNKIWVMGGQTTPQFAPATEVLYNDVWNSSDGVNWTQVTASAPWSPRGMIGGAVEFNGRMWLLGGGTYDTPGHPTRLLYNDVWSSADGVNWTQATTNAPWSPREYHDVAVFDNKMWVMEGWDTTSGNRNDVWYSSDGMNWTQLPGTPWAARHAASVFLYDNAMWMVAGNNMESDVWRLEAVPEPTLASLLLSSLAALGVWQTRRRSLPRIRFAAARTLCPIRLMLIAMTTLVLLFVFSLPGCGGKPAPPIPKTYPVSGKVVASHNQIPTGSMIQFQPQDAALTAQGQIEADGSFKLGVFFHGNVLGGATEGSHHVTIIPPMTVERTGRPIILEETYTIEPKENHLTIKVGGY